MATGIPAGSRQESRFLSGSCREMKNLAGKQNFPSGILTGSWQEKILAGILARIPAGSRRDLAKTSVIPPRQP